MIFSAHYQPEDNGVGREEWMA